MFKPFKSNFKAILRPFKSDLKGAAPLRLQGPAGAERHRHAYLLHLAAMDGLHLARQPWQLAAQRNALRHHLVQLNDTSRDMEFP